MQLINLSILHSSKARRYHLIATYYKEFRLRVVRRFGVVVLCVYGSSKRMLYVIIRPHELLIASVLGPYLKTFVSVHHHYLLVDHRNATKEIISQSTQCLVDEWIDSNGIDCHPGVTVTAFTSTSPKQ